MKVSIYVRRKNDAGQWRYRSVNVGRGRRPADLRGPFYLRYLTPEGRQTFAHGGDTLEDAMDAAGKLRAALEAKAKGLTVAELDAAANAGHVPIRAAIDKYLEQKKAKRPKTLAQYKLVLNEFAASLRGRVRFMDEITVETLRKYRDFMLSEGFSGRTTFNRVSIVHFLLKKNSISVRLPRDEMPVVEEENAVPYADEELKKLFARMDGEETVRYKFFLGTACRAQEVTFAAWQDIDFAKGTYQVRRKDDVGFTPKSHESRTAPLPSALVAMLKERRKNPAHPRWIFVNEEGRPDNHFLRKLKRIALHAGLNCGHCRTTVTVGEGDKKREAEITCKTRPVCEHWYLHRFRKTCATRWQEKGIPVRTIQAWLGHKNLETTMIYLGVTDSEKLRPKIDEAYGD